MDRRRALASVISFIVTIQAACVPLPPLPIFVSPPPAIGEASCEVTIVRDKTSIGVFSRQYVFVNATRDGPNLTVAGLEASEYTTLRLNEGPQWVGVTYRVGKFESLVPAPLGIPGVLWLKRETWSYVE